MSARGSLHRLDRLWRPTTPAARLAALRILVGTFAVIYLAIRLPHLSAFADFDVASFRPTGVISLLERPLAAPLPGLFATAALALGVAFTLGWRFTLTGPLFAAALLWVTSYRNSWGMIFHTENLMVMHVIIIGLGASADAWSLDARRHRGAGRPAATAGRCASPPRSRSSPTSSPASPKCATAAWSG